MIEGMWDGAVGVLLLGLVIGMQHALESDHVAAVSSIAARQTSARRIVTHGAVWGLERDELRLNHLTAAFLFPD